MNYADQKLLGTIHCTGADLLEKIWRKYKPWIVGILCCLLAIVFFVYHAHASAEKQAELKKTDALLSQKPDESAASMQQDSSSGQEAGGASSSQTDTIMVDIKGAVAHPGVYPLQTTDRVNDAIERAGGFTAKADVNQMNLALKVKDEMVIYVPKKGEKSLPQVAGSSSAVSGDAQTMDNAPGGSTPAKVNINEADVTGLQNLPGIGPAKAQAILQYRTEHGPFKSVDDLNNVSGIGDKTLEKIKPAATTN